MLLFVDNSLVFDSINTKKDGADSTNIWSPQRNIHHYNDALQKYKSNGSLSW